MSGLLGSVGDASGPTCSRESSDGQLFFFIRLVNNDVSVFGFHMIPHCGGAIMITYFHLTKFAHHMLIILIKVIPDSTVSRLR